MTRYVALLRGVNLASKRRVAMGDLRALLEGHGHEAVRTQGQSGNVLLASDLAPRKLQAALEKQIEEGLGLPVDVIVRTRDELAAVVEANPLVDVVTEGKWLQVTFLDKPVARAVARELEAADLAPERVAVRGREIYAWHANGLQKSPLAKLLTDRRLGGTGTSRNWNTVVKLLELVDA
jgi:uncharacterized protein (DUF1697 family)